MLASDSTNVVLENGFHVDLYRREYFADDRVVWDGVVILRDKNGTLYLDGATLRSPEV